MLRLYQAKDAVKEAQRSDPDSIFTHFSVYKVAVLENNVERGIWGILLEKDSYLTIISSESAFITACPCLSC